ncbi:MAG: hypothetical protein Q8J62_08025 [Candidatus Cloacimonadaceae bacterium]|nr:hypothetical protein [Candidatus Cloacimonadaceae bacterium]
MVSKTRLALILLLVCLGTQVLLAQGDVAPLILRDFVLNVPSGWEKNYEPAELVFVGELDTEGRIILISIFDEKQELRALLERGLAVFQLKDKNLPTGVRRFIVSLKQETPAPMFASEIKPRETPVSTDPLKKRIDIWIKSQRDAFDLFSPRQIGESPFSKPCYAYRGFFMHSGLNNIDRQTRRLGYTHPATLFSSTLYDSYYQAFYTQNETGNYENRVYPFHIALTDLQTGLGDYDHRFARGSFAKNELFGVPGFFYTLGFMAQNGWWEQQNSAQSSMKHYLSVPIVKSIRLETEYADFSRGVSMIQLLPAYWRSALFSVDHNYEHIYAALRNPIIDIEVLRINEVAKSNIFHTNLKLNSTQIKAGRAFNLFGNQFSMGYEHLESKRNFDAVADFEDKLQVAFDRSQKNFNARLKAELNDYESYLLDAELSTALGFFLFGLEGFYNLDKREPLYSTADIYTPGETRQLAFKSLKSELGGAMSYAGISGLVIEGAFGQRSAIQSEGLTDDTISAEYPFLYGSATLKLSKRIGNYLLDLKHDTRWQEEIDILREHPQWQSQNSLILTRELPYNNAIFAGVGVLGHSDFRSMESAMFKVEASAAVDLWAGVRITNLFEISFALKNIGDADIYGVYPIPASMHASIRWFYLN